MRKPDETAPVSRRNAVSRINPVGYRQALNTVARQASFSKQKRLAATAKRHLVYATWTAKIRY